MAARRPTIQAEVAAVSPAGMLLGKPVTTTLLVDSGADRTMLDSSVATALGIDLTTCPIDTVAGVGTAGVQVRVANVIMQLCGRWIIVPASFDTPRQPQLLGREGAFDSLMVAFMHRNNVLLAAAI